MYETVQSPYRPSLSDLAYKYDYLIAALLVMLVIWLYFTLQRQKYLELLEAKNLELETAAKQALAASEAKSSFLSRMSHEIRYAAQRHPGLYQTGPAAGKTKPPQDNLQKISYSSELLLGIVNDVLV